MRRVWQRMAGQYGNNWVNQFGEVPSEEWCVALDREPEWVLAIALDDCFKRNTPWPPTLPEFMTLCGAVPAYKNPDLSTSPQIEEKTVTPGQLAFLDCQKRFNPGQPGRFEYYRERLEHHEAMACQK